MLVAVFYQFLLFIRDPIFLCGFKQGDEALDLPGLEAIFIGHGADGDFILDYIHEC